MDRDADLLLIRGGLIEEIVEQLGASALMTLVILTFGQLEETQLGSHHEELIAGTDLSLDPGQIEEQVEGCGCGG